MAITARDEFSEAHSIDWGTSRSGADKDGENPPVKRLWPSVKRLKSRTGTHESMACVLSLDHHRWSLIHRFGSLSIIKISSWRCKDILFSTLGFMLLAFMHLLRFPRLHPLLCQTQTESRLRNFVLVWKYLPRKPLDNQSHHLIPLRLWRVSRPVAPDVARTSRAGVAPTLRVAIRTLYDKVICRNRFRHGR
ncbi:hypothetical protein CC79DRAFT_465026 [Sarocladium strictum]